MIYGLYRGPVWLPACLPGWRKSAQPPGLGQGDFGMKAHNVALPALYAKFFNRTADGYVGLVHIAGDFSCHVVVGCGGDGKMGQIGHVGPQAPFKWACMEPLMQADYGSELRLAT